MWSVPDRRLGAPLEKKQGRGEKENDLDSDAVGCLTCVLDCDSAKFDVF